MRKATLKEILQDGLNVIRTRKEISIFCCNNCKRSFTYSCSVNVQLLDCEFERKHMLNEVKPARLNYSSCAHYCFSRNPDVLRHVWTLLSKPVWMSYCTIVRMHNCVACS